LEGIKQAEILRASIFERREEHDVSAKFTPVFSEGTFQFSDMGYSPSRKQDSYWTEEADHRSGIDKGKEGETVHGGLQNLLQILLK